MEERTFPRGGVTSAAKVDSGSASRKRRASSPPATTSTHKIFTELGDLFPDNTSDNIQASSSEKFQESNIFTKLKKQKLTLEKRKEANRLRKKNQPKPAKLVRDEDKIVEHLTYTVRVYLYLEKLLQCIQFCNFCCRL